MLALLPGAFMASDIKKMATHRVIRHVCTACVIVSKSACSNAVCQSEMTPQLIVPLDAAHKRRDAPLIHSV